jgi:hypothetical protein
MISIELICAESLAVSEVSARHCRVGTPGETVGFDHHTA